MTDLSDNWSVNDSFQDNSLTDNSDTWSVNDSFQDNSMVDDSLDVDVAVDDINVGSPTGDMNDVDF